MADTPKVTKEGLLDRPYPIKSRGDVNRARVLPSPRAETAPAKAVTPIASKTVSRDTSLDRPAGAFDQVMKRRRLQREISGRR